MKRLIVPSILLALGIIARAQTPPPVQVVLGDVEDRRTTGKFFGGLEVEVKLLGDIVQDATGTRVITQKAVDDTGRDLLDAEKAQNQFERTNERGGQNSQVTLRLKNPARRATVIKELSGEVDLFVPNNDPTAVVKFENFQSQTGTPLASPVLQANGIQITVWTKTEYDAAREKKKAEAEKQAKGNIGAAIGQAFGQMFDSFSSMNDNDLALHIQDPNDKIVSIEIKDADGKAIRKNGSMTTGEKGDRMAVYEYGSKLPATAQLVISAATDKAMVKVPFKLTDVMLP